MAHDTGCLSVRALQLSQPVPQLTTPAVYGAAGQGVPLQSAWAVACTQYKYMQLLFAPLQTQAPASVVVALEFY